MNLQNSAFILGSFLLFYSALVQGIVCPEPDIVSPCTCVESEVRCEGNSVTQEVLNRIFKTIRDYNSLQPEDQLLLSKFSFGRTEMTHLNLTPLLYTTTSDFFMVTENRQLESIGGPEGSHEGSIVTPTVFLAYNYNLTDAGLGESLKYFDPSLKRLDMHDSKIKGSANGNVEFLPGIWNLTQLTSIDVDRNDIRVIEGGQFAKNNGLTTLFLGRNMIEQFRRDAFAFDPAHPSIQNETLTIYLTWMGLKGGMLNMTENGLLALDRPISLFLSGNEYEFIGQDEFEPFLERRDGNELDFYDNPLICDERMAWLHNQKDMYQSRVIGADYSNDPGHDVFTTSLIS